VIKSFMRIFGIVTEYRGRLIVSQVSLFISAVASVGFATLVAPMVNQGMVEGDAQAALSFGFWMLVLAVVSGISMAIAASQAVFFSQGVGYVIRTKLYDKIQEYTFENFDHLSSSQLMVRLNADVVNVQNAMLYAILLALYAPFMLIATLILSIINTPDLVWVLLVVMVVVVALLVLLIPPIVRAYRKRQHHLDGLNSTLTENLSAMAVVKAFIREDYEIEKFNVHADLLRGAAYKAAWRVAFLAPMQTGIGQLGVILALWVGGTQILTGSGMTVGQMSAFTTYLGLVITPLALIAIVIPFVLRGDVSAERILEAYDFEPTISDKDPATQLDPAEVEGRIVFDDVSFSFVRPDGEVDPPVLKHINLAIEPGQKVGFLGATGAGKTALANLIPRFYDPTEGRITIDGVDIADMSRDDLRSIVGIALQEAILFQGDLRFNLKFANVDVSDDVVIDAAQAADAYGFAANLPGGWEAPVARRGYNFSGGQRQRLSITRALTGQPKIIILDDSTSALDASTEGRVQDAIPSFMDNGTVIYVAQRISAVIDLDHIYLLENGEIVAEGTHEHLLATSALYQEIYESQLGAGITEGVDLAVAE
jgi:ABC-type multidrug transport system fused ATPase/permease subunit